MTTDTTTRMRELLQTDEGKRRYALGIESAQALSIRVYNEAIATGTRKAEARRAATEARDAAILRILEGGQA